MTNIDLVKNKLDKILDFLNPNVEIKIKDMDGTVKVDITGDDISYLIGYRGESLDALQHILGISVNKDKDEWQPVAVDINNYKLEKLQKLDEMIKGYIDRVRFHQKDYRLPVLSAYERKYVHTFVSTYDDIQSESRGEGRERRIFLMPKQ